MEVKNPLPLSETIIYTGVPSDLVEVEENFQFFFDAQTCRTIDVPLSCAVWQSAYMPEFERVRKQKHS